MNYDGGNLDWFTMDGNPKEWAACFHGTDFEFMKNIT
jgi:hypothetical protein